MKKVLVIGDFMVDLYVYVNTTRKAPEANIPVWDEVYREKRPGGAANVAANLAYLGGTDVEVSVAGILDDRSVRDYFKLNGIHQHLLTQGGSMMKTRYVTCNEENKNDVKASDIVLRVDNFRKFDEYEVKTFSDLFRTLAARNLADYDVIVISDYDKGTVTAELVDFLKHHVRDQMLKGKDVPVIVDSKRKDLRMYAGMMIMKLNHEEYSAQVSSKDYSCVERFFDYTIITKGAAGTEIHQCEADRNEMKFVIHKENFPVQKQKSIDVTGCGDTHTAGLALGMVKTNDVRLSVRLANACAASVVKKFGTSVADKEE